MQRVLVFGIDAATLDLVEPWVAAGHLPTFARLMREGSYAPMRSTVPAMSPPAWTSMITGQNPGKHGIFDFVRLLPGSYRLIGTRRDQTRFRTMFDHAGSAGHKIVALNIPLTYPPPPVNGIMVSGLGTPSNAKYSYPPALHDELLGWGYAVDPAVHFEPGNDAAYIADVERLTRIQADAFKRLLQREPWDIGMIVFRIVDEFQSYLWHHMDAAHPWHKPAEAARFGDAILNSYRLMDTLLAECLAVAGPDTTTLVVSDHGGGTFLKEVFLNVWLKQGGWLQHKQQVQAVSNGYTKLMRRFGITRERITPKLDNPLVNALKKIVPLRWQHAILPEEDATLANTVDWSRTKAYSIGNIGQIFVNLKGREPEGIVEPGAEYERLLDELTAALYQLTDDGQPVVDKVFRRSEIYHGPYASQAADLHVIMRNMSYIAHSSHELAHPQLFGPSLSAESGTHRPHGLLVAHGPKIAANGRQAEVQITDVAPTLLWLLDVPLPDDLDGKLVESFVQSQALSEQPVQTTSAPAPLPTEPINYGWENDEEEAEVLERLKNLGYID